MKFIHSFHDGHFDLRVKSNRNVNYIFDTVVAELPFLVFNEKSRIFVVPYENDPFLNDDVSEFMVQKHDARIFVERVDDRDPFSFFYDFFGDFDNMKTRQGSLVNTLNNLYGGIRVLSYPMEELFSDHIIYYSDGSKFKFNFGFSNLLNKPKTRNERGIKIKSDARDFVTLEQELDVLNHKSAAKRSPLNARDENMPCTTLYNVNYLFVSTFNMNEADFINNVTSCAKQFDENSYPIVIMLQNNGGGYVNLEAYLFHLLMPNSDSRIVAAIRKSYSNEIIAMSNGTGLAGLFADYDNNCLEYSADATHFLDFWTQTCEDDLGNNITHNRTNKAYVAYKDMIRGYDFDDENYNNYTMKNPRKPTDLMVVTDGFCFSACSMFVYDVIHSGAAIVAGYGVTHPNDTLYAAAQCPSTVIDPEMHFSSQLTNSVYGMLFQATFLETYENSVDKDEKIPGDYDDVRIDKHLGYYSKDFLAFADYTVLDGYIRNAFIEFQTKCNSNNPRLVLVTNDCQVSDIHALNVGYSCGSDGEWNRSECKISSCMLGYSVDFETNTCIENKCDLRHSASNFSSCEEPEPWIEPTDPSSGKEPSSHTDPSSHKDSSSAKKDSSSSKKDSSSSKKESSSSEKESSSSLNHTQSSSVIQPSSSHQNPPSQSEIFVHSGFCVNKPLFVVVSLVLFLLLNFIY